VDADGWWSKDEAIEWLSDAEHIPLSGIEQPLPRGREQDLAVLRDLAKAPIIADESIVCEDDVHRVADLGAADAVSLGICKCGGLLAALRLASIARRADLEVRLGSGLGETSILAAAGLRFLQVCPSVRHAEGRVGTSVLSDDTTRRPLSYGFGGRPPSLPGPGLGVQVDTARLRELADREAEVIHL
jgi:L-alanine-DL-glutamate epimerase-like enolase superfamily enzyme